MSNMMDRWERMLVDMGSMLDRLDEKSNRTYRDQCDDVFNVSSRERREHRNFGGDGVNRRMGGVKITIPQFKGMNDPEAYVAWEEKIELRFECHDYSGERKLRLIVSSFVDYALIWWDELTGSRRRNGERCIEAWGELRAIMRRRYAPNHFCRRDRRDWEFREEPRRYSGVGYSREEKTPSVEHVGNTSNRKTGLDYKLEFLKIRDLINSQNNHKKEQKSKRENCEVVSCEEKGKELQKSEREVELQKENEEESSETKKESEVILKEGEREVEEELAKTNNSLPILNTSVLQVTEELFPANNHVELPPVPCNVHPWVSQQLEISSIPKIDFVIPEETTKFQGHWKDFLCNGLNFSYLPKIDFVIPEETMEFQRHWRNLICTELSEGDDQNGNNGTLEVILKQVYGLSNARKMHGYSSNEVFGAFQTCRIKQLRREHFDQCDGDWVYNRRRRIRGQRRSKLHPRGDGPFHVLELIGGKGYNLSIQVMDSRSNPFEERGGDVIRDRQSLGRALESKRLKLTSQGTSFMLGSRVESNWISTKWRVEDITMRPHSYHGCGRIQMGRDMAGGGV